jgi:Ser/Thr protein kinase RdoA (MazF antagonist)
MTSGPDAALRELGLTGGRVRALKDLPGQNASWLVERPGREPVVLRRYNPLATVPDLAYEHAVLRHLSARGWRVPDPLSAIAEVDGDLYCVTRYVPGVARHSETPVQRAQRGRDLARLELALRPLADDLGQRPGWRPQHTAVTVHEDVDWRRCVEGLRAVDERLADRAETAATSTTAALHALGADQLPVTVVHGDFAPWNVHYDDTGGGLVGVIDFGLSHLDSRPYELAIARAHRAPETIDAYRGAHAAAGWPLTPLEEEAIPHLHRAFRVDMVAWLLHDALASGRHDLPRIEHLLTRTTDPSRSDRRR